VVTVVSTAVAVVLIVVVVVAILWFFCVSVDLLDCCHYNKDRKVFQFFPEFNVPVSFIFFFMK